MSSEFYEAYKAIRQVGSQDAHARREAASRQFEAARDLAREAGLTLIQRTEIHYSLSSPTGWLLNIYPGNKRLYHDRNRPKPPFLRLGCDWNLLDVVKSAIQGEKCET